MNLGLIVSRAGSKGLKNKNILPLGEKPLIKWVIDEAKKSKKLDKIVLSTNCSESIKIAKETGIEVPFIRSEKLASDESLIVDTLIDALEFFKEKQEYFENVVLLQPTSPFTIAEDIDKAISKAITYNADTVITGYNSEQLHPSIMFKKDSMGSVKWFSEEERMINRQMLEKTFIRTGNVYVFKSENLFKRIMYGSSIYAIEIPKSRALGIDDEDDFNYAKFLIENGK